MSACAVTVLTNRDLSSKIPPVVVVGFSGGVDSTVLLHRLASWRSSQSFELHAVHVNHGIASDADAWASHCALVCESLDVPLTVLHADPAVIRSHSDGFEAGARAMRYGLILPWLRMFGGEAVLVLGHHQDDQAETFLLRALRGSSPAGLASMREWSVRDGVRLWRPLLATSREDVLAYARSHSLQWIEDSSNGSDDFDRNFLRHQIFPLLRSRWPQVARSFARSAELSDLDARALDALDQSQLAAVVELVDGESVLDLPGLIELDAHSRARVVRAWLQSRQFPPLPAHSLGEFERTLLHARDDAQGVVEWSGHQLRVWRSQLYAMRAPRTLTMAPRAIDVAARSIVEVPLPNESQLVFRNNSDVAMTFTVSGREGGEKIRLPNRDHHSSVKNLLNQQTPPWLRMQMPVVKDANDAVWVVGDALFGEEYRFWQEQTGSSIEWQRALD